MKGVLLFLCIIAVLIFSYLGCLHKNSAPVSNDQPFVSTSLPGGVESPVEEAKIKITDGNDKTLWMLKSKENGYEIYGETKQVIGELKVEDDRVKINDKSDKVIRKNQNEGCKLYDGNDKEIYELKRKKGGFRIKNSKDTEVAKIKPKGGYLEITGLIEARVKLDGEKVKIKDDKKMSFSL